MKKNKPLVLVRPPEKTRVRGLPPPEEPRRGAHRLARARRRPVGRSARCMATGDPARAPDSAARGGARARDPEANPRPRRPSRGAGPPRASTAVWRGRASPASAGAPPAAPAAPGRPRRPPRTPRARAGEARRAPDAVTRGTGPGETAWAGARRRAHPARLRRLRRSRIRRARPPRRLPNPRRAHRPARVCSPCGNTGRARRRGSTRWTAMRCGCCPRRRRMRWRRRRAGARGASNGFPPRNDERKDTTKDEGT